MSDVSRISPAEARQAIAEDDALLVCAYDDEQKCQELQIDDAISLATLEENLDQLSRNRHIVFYCS